MSAAGIATFLQPTTLYDDNLRPFTAFPIELKSDAGACWRIVKRFESFAGLQRIVGPAHPLVLPMPTAPAKPGAASGVASDFVQEMKASLQSWLRKMLRDPSIADLEGLHVFLTTSDPGQAPPEIDRGVFRAEDSADQDAMTQSEQMDTDQPMSAAHSTSPTANTAASAKHDPDQPGVKLEDFHLLKVIGKGSFGKVMQVRKIDTGEIFAMKVLTKDNIVKRNQVEHTKTERNVLEYIHHPFIVQLRYAFQTKNKLYFVLDYCAGGELFFHLGKMGKFSEPLAKFYTAEIVLAIEYLHNLGIVYRDLKPENVLLDAEGHIALTDFGLSKEGIVDNSSAHSFCGTPEYLAPEILNRTGHGRAADWWSLGALLYEMLTGMPPFYSRDRDRLFQKILTSELQFPRNVSHEAKVLLRGLLCRDPTERLGSGSDDAASIKACAFFADVDFDALTARKLQPPFQPVVTKDETTGILNTDNVDPDFLGMPIHSVTDDDASGLKGAVSGRFQNFTYVSRKEDVALYVRNEYVFAGDRAMEQ